MKEKEIAEIRKRFNINKTNIKSIRGCYVNENKEIISEFNQFFGTMPRDEGEEVLTIIKKTLSGTLGKNLIDLEFSNQQVVDSDEHNLLMRLKDSELEDNEAVSLLYEKIIRSFDTEEKFLIMLVFDKYDVPYYTKDEIKLEDFGNIFSYVLCSICPVKMTKTGLSYHTTEKQFKNITADWIISNPETGFMFPAFDDRQANIYNVLYYSKDSANNHDELVSEVFNTEIPLPATAQKEVFNSILEESINEECSFDIMQNVHEQISAIITEHKVNKVEEPLVISKRNVSDILEYCGVGEESINTFCEKFDDEFGEDTKISPKNIIDVKKFEVSTPNISIKVNPERKDLVQTKIIDGVKYIMIRADENVEVNGVNIKIF